MSAIRINAWLAMKPRLTADWPSDVLVRQSVTHNVPRLQGGDAEAEDSSNRAATPKAAPAAAEPFVGGGNEPTPAEAAGGRAAGAGAEPTQNGSAGPAQGAWAPPASSAAEPDSAGEPEDAKAASAGDVSLGLTHSDDGTVKVSLSVGGEGR